jgi:hypothetical protein
MAKRQLIPAALREELTEYSSLLRALRTTQALDVTALLTEPYASNDKNGEDDWTGRSSESVLAAAPPLNTSADRSSSKRKLSEFMPEPEPHWRYRDQWTRWPIPAKDVPAPDWSLEDEIAAIVKQVLAPACLSPFHSSTSSASSEDDEIDDDEDEQATRPIDVKLDQSTPDIDLHTDSEDEGDLYHQSLAKTLTPIIHNKLESIFALIATHTIARTDGMQNRIEPFDWRDLINILGSSAAAHLVDETYDINPSCCFAQTVDKSL